MIEAKTTRRSWLSFSLWTLFIFVTLISVLVGLFLYRANKQRLAVARLEKLGAQIEYDFDLRDFRSGSRSNLASPAGPQWLRGLLGVDYFRTANCVSFEGPNAKDDDLKLLNDLPNLVALGLGECSSVTGGALSHLSNTPKLAIIVLGRRNASDEALKNLERFPRLEYLYINAGSHAEISAAGLEQLIKLKNLSWLGIGGEYFTDAILEPLKRLTALKDLILDGTNMTDMATNVLKAQLPNCEVFSFHKNLSE